jgi:hypothetical protein
MRNAAYTAGRSEVKNKLRGMERFCFLRSLRALKSLFRLTGASRRGRGIPVISVKSNGAWMQGVVDSLDMLADYKIVLYRQQDESWVAEVPAISGCYALMPTREEALQELERVFEMISEE